MKTGVVVLLSLAITASCGSGASVAKTCGEAQKDCGGTCRDLSGDDANCGACGTTCEGDLRCTAGSCLPTVCPGNVRCAQGNVCVGTNCVARSCVDARCPAGRACVDGACVPRDCSDQACPEGRACVNGACVDPACSASACALGQQCYLGACSSVACTDGLQNGSETAIDCGGSCPKCGDHNSCLVDDDCQSGSCSNGSCQAPSCTDGVKNGSETGVNCGGGTCPACGAGLACVVPGDCSSGVCTGNLCVAPSCTDGVKNGSETGLNCGGGTCPACGAGLACVVPGDCASGVCTGNLCVAPSCSDGVKNGSETEVDCGGASCPSCTIPIVSAVAPATGPTTGSTSITIIGRHFAAGGSFGVTIGGVACISATVTSATSLSCTTPTGTVGAKTVVVTNSDGTTGALANGFTYFVPSCPAGYVLVPRNAAYSGADFCVSKYVASQGGSAGVSVPGAAPWVNITQPDAITACQANGPKYDLISNAEWQAVARNIELVPANWSGGVVGSAGGLSQGISNNTQTSGKAASADDAQGCLNTGATCSGTSWNSQRRTFTLSTGEIVWDFSGNVFQWVKDTNFMSFITDSFISQVTSVSHPATGLVGAIVSNAKTLFGPAGTYTSLSTSPYGRLGWGWLASPGGGGINRGGSWTWVDRAGVFTVNLQDTSYSAASLGFRCVHHPVISLSGVSPNFGQPSGGTRVAISGVSGFSGGGSFAVTVGGVPCANAAVVNATTVACTTPAGALGTADVVVTNADGATAVLTGGYTYSNDLCAGAPALGTVCAGGALYAGQFDGGTYMVTPSGCTNSTAPVCAGGVDTVMKDWNDGSSNWNVVPGVETFTTATQPSSSSSRGDVNAAAILSFFPGSVCYHNAACFCRAMHFGGYADWYLPSKSELAFLYCHSAAGSHSATAPEENRNCTNYGGKTSELGGFVQYLYWSSTQYNGNFAWAEFFSSGSQAGWSQSNGALPVRCVRRY